MRIVNMVFSWKPGLMWLRFTYDEDGDIVRIQKLPFNDSTEPEAFCNPDSWEEIDVAAAADIMVKHSCVRMYIGNEVRR